MNSTQTINFFDESYSCEICTTTEFGIIDGDNEKEEKAFLSFDVTEKEVWGATINNKNEKEIKFLPVDHNIPVFRPDGKMAKRCDSILFSQQENQKGIFFIELKERTDKKNRTWREDSVGQLISTIGIFNSNHNIKEYNPRKAFVCNRKRPYYTYSNREELEKFREKYHVSLYVQPYIEI